MGMLIIAMICFIDDVKGVSAIKKLFFQIVAACMVVKTGTIIVIELPISGELNNIFNIILTIGWIVGITNAINLIDGLDGLSSGICMISCLSLLIIFSLNNSPLIAIVLVTAIAGALTGFLPFNFNPAKTFIGDTGSNFLGYAISVISILGVAKTYTIVVLVAPLIVLALPVFDTLMAVVRRLKNGKSIAAIIKPDAGHLHHKIIRQGFSQKQAVLILYGISASFGMFAIILLENGLIKALSFVVVVLIIVAIGYNNFIKLLIGNIYKCKKCGYEYDPIIGDKERKIDSETAFEDLPENWTCPTCGAKKENFEEID